MAVEGDAHDGKSEKITRSDVPDLNGGVDDGLDGELVEDNADSDEDGKDGEDTDITQGIHSYT